MAADPIKVEGLNEFVKNLKTIDRELPKAVRKAFNEAAELVVDDARPRVRRRSGRAQRSIKARSTQTTARVKGGGNKAPYYPFLDFGGRVGPNRSVRRPFKPDGRYIYLAYFNAKAGGEITEVMTKSLINVVESAGIAVE